MIILDLFKLAKEIIKVPIRGRQEYSRKDDNDNRSSVGLRGGN